MTSTIVACATAPGHAALALVRLSGPDVVRVRDRICRLHGGSWSIGRVRRVDLLDGDQVFDDGVAVYQRAPRSFTGEDTLEITLHGNPLLVERLVAACVGLGCTLAGPGAFTRRAVLSGKLGLVEAEGLDLAVRSTSTGGLAVSRAAGALSHRLLDLRAEVVALTAELEAWLDYPADELGVLGEGQVRDRLAEIAATAGSLADTWRIGRVLVDGARVALVGVVNAGKSSLFNRLAGQERALVHDRPGTTRDVVETRCRIGSLAVTLLDTAGERITDDPVEAAGLALARGLVEHADLVVVVLRADAPVSPTEAEILQRTSDRARIVVCNRVDRAPAAPGTIGVSALTGAGLGALEAAIERELVGGAPDPDAIVGTLRQAQLLRQLATSAEEASEALDLAGIAVAAELLVEGLEAVDELTGADTREDVLDALFARFCIGK